MQCMQPFQSREGRQDNHGYLGSRTSQTALVRVVQSRSHGIVHTVALIITVLQESEFTDLHFDFAEVQ
jgi:hypothetical protein